MDARRGESELLVFQPAPSIGYALNMCMCPERHVAYAGEIMGGRACKERYSRIEKPSVRHRVGLLRRSIWRTASIICRAADCGNQRVECLERSTEGHRQLRARKHASVSVHSCKTDKNLRQKFSCLWFFSFFFTSLLDGGSSEAYNTALLLNVVMQPCESMSRPA